MLLKQIILISLKKLKIVAILSFEYFLIDPLQDIPDN